MKLSTKRAQRIDDQRKQALIRRIQKVLKGVGRSHKYFKMLEEAIHLGDPIYTRNLYNADKDFSVRV